MKDRFADRVLLLVIGAALKSPGLKVPGTYFSRSTSIVGSHL